MAAVEDRKHSRKDEYFAKSYMPKMTNKISKHM